MSLYHGVIERYREYLPVTEKTPVVTLYEGNTPLVRAEHIEEEIKAKFEIHLKLEGINPTSSFKDRGMSVAISKAVEEKVKAVICASTGNTSASAAAYAARAGLKCVVLVPEGSVALGKLAQTLMHGAQVIAIKGGFDRALELVREISEKFPVKLVNSVNPFRLEGQKTAAFEIVDFLGDAPDVHILPVGNAGNITAYWMGYKQYKDKGIATKLPKMLGFQAEGAAPIVQGKVIENPTTVATAVRVGNPASWKKAEAARDESGGAIEAVTDEEILKAYRMLASLEGVFVEPASAISLAGTIKWVSKIQAGSRVILTLTGHGLKDPDRAISEVPKPEAVEPTLEAVVQAAEL